MKRMCSIVFFVYCVTVLFAQSNNPFAITNSNWSATDGLGRKLPGYKQTGNPRPQKWVGLFYYIWHGQHPPTDTIYDISKMLLSNPRNPAYGPHRLFHYWGEPEAGYYRSDDPWVIRRNIAMMAAAGVDFVFFDVTNSFTYPDVVKRYCEISLSMKKNGVQVPYICFATNAQSGKTMNKLYDEFYSQRMFKPLWFMWEGKPLILGNPKDTVIRENTRKFFTIKYCWAWTDAQNQPNHWQWIDKYPQDFGWSKKGIPDQIPVAVASHPISNIGNSYCNGEQPPYDSLKLTRYTGQGRFFAEQWRRVFEVQPKVVMITQFNEWMAQRFITGVDHSPKFLGNNAVKDATYFVDAYNEEYNRDIEPMKGGHTDNMYYQMVSYIRLFKGMNAPAAPKGNRNVRIDGKFNDWKNICPDFWDFQGDTEIRNFPSANKKMLYKNHTGRNDLVLAKVAATPENISFFIQSNEAFRRDSVNPLPVLYINTDTIKKTGWEGYDLKISMKTSDDKYMIIYRFDNKCWIPVDKAEVCYSGNKLELAIPRRYFTSQNKDVCFEFKWHDAAKAAESIIDFFTNGDTAPDRRFDYFFTSER